MPSMKTDGAMNSADALPRQLGLRRPLTQKSVGGAAGAVAAPPPLLQAPGAAEPPPALGAVHGSRTSARFPQRPRGEHGTWGPDSPALPVLPSARARCPLRGSPLSSCPVISPFGRDSGSVPEALLSEPLPRGLRRRSQTPPPALALRPQPVGSGSRGSPRPLHKTCGRRPWPGSPFEATNTECHGNLSILNFLKLMISNIYYQMKHCFTSSFKNRSYVLYNGAATGRPPYPRLRGSPGRKKPPQPGSWQPRGGRSLPVRREAAPGSLPQRPMFTLALSPSSYAHSHPKRLTFLDFFT